MLDITRKVCPIAVEAFEEHIRGSVAYSAKEHRALQRSLLDSDGPRRERLEEAAGEAGIEGKALERFLKKLEDGESS
jgi:thymidylate synthase (FAD)